MISTVLFGAVGFSILLSAWFVVRSTNLVRAVLWLGVSLFATAGLYGMLDAPFLAGVQVLTYVGGVVTLMIFGVMVTRRHTGDIVEAESVGQFRAFLVAGGFFGAMTWAVMKTDLPPLNFLPVKGTADIAKSLVGEYVFAFEVASLLLLVAIIGAVVLARRRDPDPVTGKESGAIPNRAIPANDASQGVMP